MRLRDFEYFRDWLHVISNPVVVRVFAGETDVERVLTKIKILKALKIIFDITLIRISNNLILFRNQVSTIDMVEALYISGARICRAGFFGMKMPLGIAEPLIDYFS